MFFTLKSSLHKYLLKFSLCKYVLLNVHKIVQTSDFFFVSPVSVSLILVISELAFWRSAFSCFFSDRSSVISSFIFSCLLRNFSASSWLCFSFFISIISRSSLSRNCSTSSSFLPSLILRWLISDRKKFSFCRNVSSSSSFLCNSLCLFWKINLLVEIRS